MPFSIRRVAVVLFAAAYIAGPVFIASTPVTLAADETEPLYWDISASSITVSPATPAVGQEVRITVPIRNSGTYTFFSDNGIRDYTYTFQNFSSASVITPSVDAQNNLGPNESRDFVFTGTFTQAGTQALSLAIDTHDAIAEKNEDDNTAQATVTVLPATAAKDLAVTDIAVSPEPTLVNENATITVTVTNKGEYSFTSASGLRATTESFSPANVQFNAPNTFEQSAATYSDYPTTDTPLAPGGTFTYTYHGTFTELGAYTASFSVDTLGFITESDEENNDASRTVTVTTREAINDFNFGAFSVQTGASRALVRWDTSQDTTATLQYKEEGYSTYDYYLSQHSDISEWPVSDTATTSHQIMLTGLAANTSYEVTVTGARNGTVKKSDPFMFKTGATDELAVHEQPTVTTQKATTTVRWQTDAPAEAIAYITPPQASGPTKYAATTNGTTHTVTLTDLAAGTYQVYTEATSTLGFSVTTPVQTFAITQTAATSGEPTDGANASDATADSHTDTTNAPAMAGERAITNTTLYASVRGNILLTVEEHGEAYYVHPRNQAWYYLGRPADAFAVMREQGVGITNADLRRIPVGLVASGGTDTDGDQLADALETALQTNPAARDTDGDGYSDYTELTNGYNPNGSGTISYDPAFSHAQSGVILLQVESAGEAWYVNPTDNKRYFLGRPADAFAVMRSLGIGIATKTFNTL